MTFWELRPGLESHLMTLFREDLLQPQAEAESDRRTEGAVTVVAASLMPAEAAAAYALRMEPRS